MQIPEEATPSSSPQGQPSLDGDAMLGEEARRSWQKENRKILLMVLVVAGFMAVAHFTPLRGWVTNVQAWKGHIRELGWTAPFAFTVLCALAVMLGVPRLSLCAMAGLLFGFAEGMALSLAGSVAGSYGAFMIARKGGRKAVLMRAERWTWLKPLLGGATVMRVFWIRQLMLPGVVLNVLLGVSGVGRTTFLLGTLLGYAPLNAAFTLVGSGLGKEALARGMLQLLGGVGLLNGIGWVVWRLGAKPKV